MGKSIGIDLGTTNSVASIRKIETEIIKNSEGDEITPSCVSTKKKKQIIVGKDAIAWRKQNPENTITGVKRLMGRNIKDAEVKKLITDNKLSYKISEYSKGSENSIGVHFANDEFTPQEMSAEILKKIKRDAEKSLKDSVEYCVITVPSYFNDKQKHATRTAAALAGLRVRRLLSEPTAAAISFGIESIAKDEAKNIIVFDFGGGTFDLSILTISGGQYIEQGKGGDMWLGGDDIDYILTDYVLKEIEKKYSIDNIKTLLAKQDVKNKNLFYGELKTSIENAKISLTTEAQAYVEIIGILRDNNNKVIDIDIKITKDIFNNLIEDIVQRTIMLTKSLIEEIDFTEDLIDKILLVGGSSKIPAIANALKKSFGDEKILIHKHPMLAISEGAAILSHRLSESYECPECGKSVQQNDKLCGHCDFNLEKYTIEHGVFDVVHTTAHDYYIQLENGDKHLLIEKNTPLPCEAEETFKLLSINQYFVHLNFINVVNEANENIGNFWLGIDCNVKEVLPPELFEKLTQYDVSEGLEIKTKMIIDENNIIKIEAFLKDVPEVKLSKKLSRGGIDEKIFLSIEKLIEEVNKDNYSKMIEQEVAQRLLSTIEDTNKLVDDNTEKINYNLLQQANLKLNKAKRIFNEKNQINGYGGIVYIERLFKKLSDIIPKKTKTKIDKFMKEYKKIINTADYDADLTFNKKIDNFIEKNLDIYNEIFILDAAYNRIKISEPKEAKKLKRVYDKILTAHNQKNENKVHSLYEKYNEEIDQARYICSIMNSGTSIGIKKGVQI
jgi:molecular chaperone DnaK